LMKYSFHEITLYLLDSFAKKENNLQKWCNETGG